MLKSQVVAYGRDPRAPLLDAITTDGDVEVPIDAVGFGFWLKAAFGAPTTAGTVAAAGAITFSAQPAVNSTLTINGTAFTFVASGAVGNQVNIGANLAATMTALAVALNASVVAGVALATYTGTATALNIALDVPGSTGNPNAGDPGTVADGDLWYNSSTGKFRGRQGGVSIDLSGGSGATAAYGVLQANYTLTSATAAQKLFNWSTNGALSLAAGTYRFSCSLLLTSMSATSGSAKFDLKGAGSAIFGKMSMQDFGSRGTVAVGGTTATSGTASDVPASGGALASVATSAALRASIHGTFEITTAGTIIPSIALDVAAAAVVNAGSYFECIYLGPAAALGGSWS